MKISRRNSAARYRFGPFEADPLARELRKNQEIVKLQDLPFRILALLLARPNEVVSRDELRKSLWPEGTYVEFEHGLNTAIKKLRQALEDDAEHPQYVDTVPRQGYRFIAKVERIGPPPRVRPLAMAAATVVALVLLTWVFLHARSIGGHKEDFPRDARRVTADSGLSYEPAISPDGELIAYASDRGTDGNLDIWVVHAQGGNPLRLTDHEADDREPHFCPDGRVVFRSDRDGGGVYIAPALGGNAILLAPQGRGPQCSPDGKQVAYWVGHERMNSGANVFVVSTAGGTPKPVAADLPSRMRPVWSPDGEHLLVFGHRQRHKIIPSGDWWLAPVGGGPSVPLHVRERLMPALELSAGVPPALAWHPRTNEVLFSVAARAADAFSLWHSHLWTIEISPAGEVGKMRQITSGNGQQREGRFAADGTLVYSDLELDPDIWSIEIDHRTGKTSGKLQPVTTDRNWQSRPDVSRDGRWMVFRSEGENGWDFWVRDLQKGTEKRVTLSGGTKIGAMINGDGSQIAYHTLDGVYVTDTQTGSTRTICRSCKTGVADWAPDQRSLLVNDGPSHSLELVSPSGERRRVLQRSPGEGHFPARISPDGTRVAYHDGALRVARLDRGLPVSTYEWQLPDFEFDESLEWSPDGKLLYFLSRHDGSLCIWAARPGTADPPFAVQHLHSRRRALFGDFSVAPDRLLLGIHELTGNVWSWSGWVLTD